MHQVQAVGGRLVLWNGRNDDGMEDEVDGKEEWFEWTNSDFSLVPSRQASLGSLLVDDLKCLRILEVANTVIGMYVST